MRLAYISNLLPTTSSDVLRATTENYALDSYQNPVFSIARFYEYTGRWPARITVVGYEMKRRRFTELHRAALHWPLDRFGYVGIDAEGDTEAAQQGEVGRATQFTRQRIDRLGCRAASERISAVYAGHVWLPWFSALEVAGAQSVHALPLVLLVRS